MENRAHPAEITFLEEIVLLALNDKGWFGNSEQRIKFGLSGALLFELTQKGLIRMKDQTVMIEGSPQTGDKVLDAALKVIGNRAKKTPLSITKAIQRLVYNNGLKWKFLLKELIRKEILTRGEYCVLWVICQEKYPLIATEVKKELIAALVLKIMGEQELTPYDRMLLAVMKSCRMIDKNFLRHEQFLKVRQKINDLTEFKEPLTESNRLVRDIQSAILKAIRKSNVSLHI